MMRFNWILLLTVFIGCSAQQSDAETRMDGAVKTTDSTAVVPPFFCNETVRVAAERSTEYLPMLSDKRIGVVGNQTSKVGDRHLVDFLINEGVDVVRIFSPEHGFRGDADAGEKVDSEVDEKTGLPVVSLYGKNKKPRADQLTGVDVLIFDIQDVGARFYTYISTLHLVMEAAAENNKKVVVLDRPNPNGHYTAGPVLKDGFDSFVGMHPVPVVHGMTIGEYAQMINGEKWLKNGLQCDLEVIKCSGWTHQDFYELPVAPSPNLPTMAAIYLYPSLCFFEGTIVSIGRGTDLPFQVVGHPNFNPDSSATEFTFTPTAMHGAKHPKLEGEKCIGLDLQQAGVEALAKKQTLDLNYLKLFYDRVDAEVPFFLKNNFIDLLAGSDQLRKQLLAGKTVDEIQAGWQADLEAYRGMRKKYLLYDL